MLHVLKHFTPGQPRAHSINLFNALRNPLTTDIADLFIIEIWHSLVD